MQLGLELIFTHEVGHIFGANHNREVAGNGNGFNYGYLLRGSNMLTVMAYFSGNFRQWIPYFSNDDYTVSGVQMGTARDDNRRQLMEARFAVANRGNELGCSFPVKCRFVYAAWLALLRLPYQRCWQKLRKQTDISQESYSPGQKSDGSD